MSLLDDILDQASHFGFTVAVSRHDESSYNLGFPSHYRPPNKIFVRAEIDDVYNRIYGTNPKDASKILIHNPRYKKGYLTLTMPVLEEFLATEKIGRPYYRCISHCAIYGRGSDGMPHKHGHGDIIERVYVYIKDEFNLRDI